MKFKNLGEIKYYEVHTNQDGHILFIISETHVVWYDMVGNSYYRLSIKPHKSRNVHLTYAPDKVYMNDKNYRIVINTKLHTFVCSEHKVLKE